jgi:hypothetical protein
MSESRHNEQTFGSPKWQPGVSTAAAMLRY